MALHRLKNKLARNKPLLGAWVVHGNACITELISSLGYDVVCIDLQHGSFGDGKTQNLIHAIGNNAVPFVRTMNGEDGVICRALDAGAMGIICPMVNTKEDCEKFVNACLYPPKGNRSFGAYRTQFTMKSGEETEGGSTGVADNVVDWSNSNIMSFAMVETVQALENLDAILSVRELTGIFIGPNDLGLRLGYPPSSSPGVEVLKSIMEVKEKCHAKDKFVGIFAAEGDTGNKMVKAGFNYVNVFSDINGIMMAGASELNKIDIRD